MLENQQKKPVLQAHTLAEKLGISDSDMAKVLGIQKSRLSEERAGKPLPLYVRYSLEALQLLQPPTLQRLILARTRTKKQ